MGALLHATRALGGEPAIDTAKGAGTLVRMTFHATPKSAPSWAPAA